MTVTLSNYVLYQGSVYEVAEFIRDNSGAIVSVRLETQSGVTVPIPIDQIVPLPGTNLGPSPNTPFGGNNAGSQVISAESAPPSPVVGQVWKNTSTGTVNGVPTGHYGVWNGTQWIAIGTTQPSSSVISSATAPTSPQTGQVWLNTSGGVVSGVPAGSFSVWNGTAWVPIGSYQPTTSTASSAATVILTGDATGTGTGTVPVTLANSGVSAGTYGSAAELVAVTVDAKGRITNVTEFPLPPGGGGGVAEIDVNGSGNLIGNINLAGVGITQSGQTVNFDAYATDAEVTAAIAAHTAAANPHAQYATDSEIYGDRYLAQPTAPSSPQIGDIWKNTSGGTVSGVASGNFGVWDGTVWIDRGSQYPFLSRVTLPNLPDTVKNPGFLVQNSVSQLLPVNVWSPVNPGAAVRDTYSGYNAVAGTYTIPPGLGGLWQVVCNWENDITIPQGQLYAAFTKNTTTISTASVAGVASFMTVGIRSIILAPGDILRFYAFPLVLSGDPATRSVISMTTSGFLVEAF